MNYLNYTEYERKGKQTKCRPNTREKPESEWERDIRPRIWQLFYFRAPVSTSPNFKLDDDKFCNSASGRLGIAHGLRMASGWLAAALEERSNAGDCPVSALDAA